MDLRSTLHLFGHLLMPGLAARVFFPLHLRRAWLLMVLTNLIDLDHLLVSPVYDPNRCSVGFHPLHSLPAILVYVLFLVPVRTRVAGVGLLLHIGWDQVDCWWMGVG